MRAFDYTTQKWVEGEAAHEVALKQAMDKLALLQSPGGADFAKFYGVDHNVVIAAARRVVLKLEAKLEAGRV